MFLGIDSAAVVYFLFWRYMEVGLGFLLEGLMGWDVRRAGRAFMDWRFGVGGCDEVCGCVCGCVCA